MAAVIEHGSEVDVYQMVGLLHLLIVNVAHVVKLIMNQNQVLVDLMIPLVVIMVVLVVDAHS